MEIDNNLLKILVDTIVSTIKNEIEQLQTPMIPEAQILSYNVYDKTYNIKINDTTYNNVKEIIPIDGKRYKNGDIVKVLICSKTLYSEKYILGKK